jgi:glyoxylase-like metal-dependent hydrolase (beta-lactamase superfamily II)
MAKSKQHPTWDEVFHNPQNITVESLNTGYIIGTKKGMFNVHSEAYQNQCSFKSAKLPVLSHLISYKNKYYLVDTGFDSSFSKRWGGSFKGFLSPFFLRNHYLQSDISLGIEKQLESRGIKPDNIFLTHAHEHCAGLGVFDNSIPLSMGKCERDICFFPFVYSTNIKSRKNVRHFDFCGDGINMPLLGSCIDVFHDGSFWVIDTHGHTKGHVSYLINGVNRTVLITGDVSNNSLGFSIGVETGSYNENRVDSKFSFDKLRKFAESYPQVEFVFGHEVPGLFEIEYKI